MGNSHPQNKTGRKVVEQKLENAKKTGVLSLCEHKLETCPNQVFEISKLTTLDLSKNKLVKLNPKLSTLKVLKSLNVDNNKLMPGSMTPISSLTKLKTLSASNNLLGRPVTNKNSKAPAAPSTAKNTDILPTPLPKGLRTILLSNNSLTTIPRSIVNNSNPLKLLEKLDLSFNNLATVPESIANLVALNDLNLDSNVIVSLPPAIGKLKRLKALSLRNNHISSATTPQPLPEELWTNTLLIDMNLHGNPMTSTQLNSMDGYDAFLSRRREVKNKDILGGALTDLDGCGLK